MEEKIITLSRPFVMKSLEEAYNASCQKEDKKRKKEACEPHAIQTSLLLINRLPEILNIKDKRTEEEKENNTNPFMYKDVEVKYVNFLEPHQMKFISDANDHQIIMLEFVGDEREPLR